MNRLIQVVLVVVTVASLGYAYLQWSEATRLAGIAEEANTRALTAETEARMQRAIANEQRAAAERSEQEARMAMAMAVQAVADCENRRK